MIARLLAALPRGGTLEHRAWERRHRLLTVLLGAHAVLFVALGLVVDEPLDHLVLELVPIVGLAAVATSARLRPLVREVAVSVGLLTCSALLIHLVDGTTEAHFHFFVVLPLIALYQRWTPLLTAIGYVVIHHLSLAGTAPQRLFNTDGAIARPIVYVVVHAVFVLAAVAVLVTFWSFTERSALAARRAERARSADAEALRQRIEVLHRTTRRVDDLAEATVHATTLVTNVSRAVEQLAVVAGGVAGEAATSAAVAERSITITARGMLAADRLHESTAEIGDIVAFIDGVAARTNLLALNATVEAARAGEVGRGFAVVATEVKDLARQTETATSDISARMDRIMGDARDATAVLGELRGVLADIAERQARIDAAVGDQLDAARGIAEDSESVTRTVQSIADDVAALTAVVRSDAAADGATAGGERAGDTPPSRADAGRWQVAVAGN